MRMALLLVALALLPVAAGCGEDEEPTSGAPPRTVTETVTSPPATAESTTSADTPAPEAGEPSTMVVRGAAGSPQTGPEFSSFVLVPESGGDPLRVAAANDLDLPFNVRRDLFNPACEGKLQGDFTVARAPARETEFDYELISVELTADDC